MKPSADPPPEPTILVAEDHTDSREAMRMLLEASGYRVVQAANGREAIELGISARPDLILMDMMMPGIDGCEATRTLRARDETQETPILAVTAMEGSRELAFAAGCNDYVSKPIDVRAFLRKIAEWLNSKRSESS